jgi:hypothetical protein
MSIVVALTLTAVQDVPVAVERSGCVATKEHVMPLVGNNVPVTTMGVATEGIVVLPAGIAVGATVVTTG